MHTLTRAEYDAEIRKALAAILPPDLAEAAMARQYPKSSVEATRELWQRGGKCCRLPEGIAYQAAELDAVLATLEITGHVSNEVRWAKLSGLTLGQYRAALANPETPEAQHAARRAGQ